MRTEITITIDTEFTIAGAFDNPAKYRPISDRLVSGLVAGKEQGLGFLLDLFARYDIRATFFVECANYFYFGDDPMRGFVRRIQAAGQDVQLHVHPCWMYFNKDVRLGQFSNNDSCAGRDEGELQNILELCCGIYERWVGQKPLALRTGNLHVDHSLYRVMTRLGIPLSSSIGMGVFRPAAPDLHLMSGRHKIDGVMEMPLLTYRDFNLLGRRHDKTLQITSCSWPEMKRLLWAAHDKGVRNVVILTHPFEFFKAGGERFRNLIRNRVNQRRLEKLCRFVRDHPDAFVSRDFGAAGRRWCGREVDNIHLGIPSWYAVGRKLHNKLNDVIWQY